MPSQLAEARKCPRCHLINPETALRCNCGFDFASGRIKASYIQDPKYHEEIAEDKSEKHQQRTGFTLIGLFVGFIGFLVTVTASLLGGIITMLAGATIVFLSVRVAAKEGKFEREHRDEPTDTQGQWGTASGDYASAFGKQMLSLIIMFCGIVVAVFLRVFAQALVSNDVFFFTVLVIGLAFGMWWLIKRLSPPRE